MKIINVNPNIKYVYHYTLKKNVEKILRDKKIISRDDYVFFTKSLNDSITAFENEMVEGKLYIDLNNNLKKREKCNKEDYCILKIPYLNDGKFCEFKFDGQNKESIYSISLAHKGFYEFEKATVLEFPKAKKITNIIAKTAVAAMMTGMILFPYKTYAASWLDVNNYDVSWYTDSTLSEYTITTANQMAGLAHLVNEENISFEGKRISCLADIDLTQNEWQTLSDVFKGNICGSHRILINGLNNVLFANKNVDGVEYVYPVIINSSEDVEKVSAAKPYTVLSLKQKLNVKYLYLNGEKLADDVVLTSLHLDENDVFHAIYGLHIIIKKEDGSKFVISTESGESIENIKGICSEKIGIPANKIIFKFNGRELDNGRTLADYNIQKESIIDMYYEITEEEPDQNPDKDPEKEPVKELEKEEQKEIEKKSEEKSNEQVIGNPATGDGIFKYVAMFVVSAIGLVITKFKIRKK